MIYFSWAAITYGALRFPASDPEIGDRRLPGRTYTPNRNSGAAFSIGLPEELGVSAALFTDIGTLLNPVADGAQLLDETVPRISTGLGIRWRSPFGPIRVDVAFPIVKESFDKEELVRFNFGTRF